MGVEQFVLGLDQGTTGSTAIAFDRSGRPVAKAYQEFTQHYPQPGWVEHNASELWEVTLAVARRAAAQLPGGASALCAIGLTNQRETTVVWDRVSGQPVGPAIVWQCRRTAERCTALQADGLAGEIRAKTGLVLDPYFSATKLQWILDNAPGARTAAKAGRLLFGTIDSWLIWNLTGGKVHATDVTNASRTMLFNLNSLQWDDDLLSLFTVPPSVLPAVQPSGTVFGETVPGLLGEASVPIAGVLGDQQAAAFGQACFVPGRAKLTYGTGGFLLLPVGPRPVFSDRSLLTTVAWGLNGRVEYALEGSFFSAGSCIQWLRDGLGIIRTAAESEALAGEVEETGGVYFVPAFTGLGAPHWDMHARGTIVGLTRGTSRAHLVRAALEAIAYQARDVLTAMTAEAGRALTALRVDGGAAANNLLLQFQADLLRVPVERPYTVETTALGAAYLAGLTVGYWSGPEEIEANWRLDRTFLPERASSETERLYAGWQRAVERAKGWQQHE
ncbi:MAG: glycerol kinase GlpK [Methanocella sp.]